jgi:DNA-binding GntR family transcriptional regulator
MSTEDLAHPRLQPARRRERLTDQAFDAIRSSIIAGAFAMGERLVETQLADELGMSRAPIREAMQRLAQQGLVDERPHQGSFVCTLTARDVANLYNVRLGIEGVAIRLFVRAGESSAPLRKSIRDMQRAAKRGSRPDVVRAEMDFHRHIVERSGNPLLVRLFNELEGHILLALALDDESFQDLSEIAEEHNSVVEAVETGSEAVAVSAYAAHIVSTVGQAMERLGGDHDVILPPLSYS